MGTIEGDANTTSDRPADIFAGYSNDMERVLLSNPGRKRRIARTFLFPDYTVHEFALIFGKMSAAAGVKLSQDLDLSDIEDILSAFPIKIRSQYNAELSSKLLYLCKEKMNARVVGTVLAEANPDQEMLKIVLIVCQAVARSVVRPVTSCPTGYTTNRRCFPRSPCAMARHDWSYV